MPKLHELIAVKICHDISGVIGAVNNGMELYSEADDSFKEQSLQLVESSAKDAVARIVFFRHALGVSGKESKSSAGALKEICEKYLEHKKITIDWNIETQEYLSSDSRLKKCFLLILLFVASRVIKANNISVNAIKDGNNTSIKIESFNSSWNVAEEDKLILDNSNSNSCVHSVENLEALLIREFINNNETITLRSSGSSLEIVANILSIT